MRRLKLMPLLFGVFYIVIAFNLAVAVERSIGSILVALFVYVGGSLLIANGLSVATERTSHL